MSYDKLKKIINENFEKKEKVGPKSDKKLVKAMRSGNQLVINGVSSRGSKTRDIYSLLGFTSAHNTINRTCK